MARLFANLVGGTVDNAGTLAAAGTTLESADLASLPALAAGADHYVAVFDPAGVSGAPFAKRITAHVASATTATIDAAALVGPGLGPARDVPNGTAWVHAALADDVRSSLLGITVPSNAARQTYTLTNTYGDVPGYSVPFVVPPSGSVLVRVEGYLTFTNNASVLVALRDGGATLAESQVAYHNNATLSMESWLSRSFRVDALAPGAAKTYTIAARNGTGAGTATFRYGGTDGPGLLTVEALP